MGEHFSSFNCILNVIEPNFCGLYIVTLFQAKYYKTKMKIVLIAFLFGICQAKPQSLEFFEKTQEAFGDEFQEKAMDYITGIDEAFHGKQTVETYESGLSGAIMDIYRDGENMYKNLREEVDWEKEMRDFRKAATDALFKDIGDAVDDVDFEPIKDTTLDFLKHTRDILQSVDWNMFRAAGKRVMEAGKDSISEIHEKVSREPKSE